jgi:hypothetical protein
LVIEAPLVTVDVLSDGTEEIRETGWERLVWSGGGDAPAVVDVVRSESVEEYAVVLRDELDRLNTVVLARTDYQFVEGPRFVSFP